MQGALDQPPLLELGEQIEQIGAMGNRMPVLGVELVAKLGLADGGSTPIDPHEDLPFLVGRIRWRWL
jgi:hypothetical protein